MIQAFIYNILSGRIGISIELHVLLRETAKAFGVEPPRAHRLSAADLLELYARFTAAEARRALADGEDKKLLYRRLYRRFRRLGTRVRKLFRPKHKQDCLAIVTLLYHNIGITISEPAPKEFEVSNCYFSSFYTPEVCGVISAIDSGIFAGVYGGGRLKFDERITAGREVCRAKLG